MKKRKDNLTNLRKELNTFKNANEYDEEIDGMNLMHFICSRNEIEIDKIKLLINNKIDINSVNAKNLKTAAHYLFENERVDELLENILNLKIDLNLRDREKNDSLLIACNNPNLSYQSLKTLINSKKLDVNTENSHKWTPIHYICSINNEHTEKKIKFLLKKKANINSQDVYLQSPLLLYLSSFSSFSPSILSTLLDNKANPNLPDLYQQTPLLFATKNDCFSIGKFHFFFFSLVFINLMIYLFRNVKRISGECEWEIRKGRGGIAFL